MNKRSVAIFLALLSTTEAFLVSPSRQLSNAVLYGRKAKDEEAEERTGGKMDPAKRAALDGVLNQIERSYGRGSVVKLGDAKNMVVDSISTGALTLDAALGGGYPKGRVIEIYGPESSGKTTLALHAIAECQRTGGTAAFVDAEHALDPNYGEYSKQRLPFSGGLTKTIGFSCRQLSAWELMLIIFL
jgi:hypothetical protein